MDDAIALKLLQTESTMIPNLILKNYVKLGMTAEEFVFLLELKAALKDGNQPFDLQTIAQIMSKDEAQIYQLLHGLIEKGIISLTSVVDDQGRNSDQYSLDPLYKKTLKLLTRSDTGNTKFKLISKRAMMFLPESSKNLAIPCLHLIWK